MAWCHLATVACCSRMMIDPDVLQSTVLMNSNLLSVLTSNFLRCTLMCSLVCVLIHIPVYVRRSVLVCVLAVAWRGLRTRRSLGGRAPGPGGSIQGPHPHLRTPRIPPPEERREGGRRKGRREERRGGVINGEQ